MTDITAPPPFCQYSVGPCDQTFAHQAQSDIFAAFASEPPTVASTLDAAIAQLTRSKPNHRWLSWRDLPVSGQLIFCEICKATRFADTFVADITVLNFNVLFEVGYAAGLERPLLLLRDTNYVSHDREYEELGLLDTIGYSAYSTSDDIVTILQNAQKRPLRIPTPVPEHRSSPIYLVLPPIDTEGVARLKSALQRSAFSFRSFDAAETVRPSFSDVARNVAGSSAVVLPLLAPERRGATVHNARCAFVAGMALARSLHVLLLQEGHFKQPIDYRDVCQAYSDARHIQPIVERLVKSVASTITSSGQLRSAPQAQRDLERLDLGDVAAENEDEQLRAYFVRTSQFQETLRGHARLVVGRKGTGKSAIFSQIRDNYARRTHDYVVLDMRPEAYQLRKLADLLRRVSEEGIREQLSVTLWYYILLTELAQCVLDRDVSEAYRDEQALKDYQALESAFEAHQSDEADFSDRLLALISRVGTRFPWDATAVSSPEVNYSIWSGDLTPLSHALGQYLARKKEVWTLVDNLDKSWPARGASEQEILMLRCLLEASRKLQRQLERNRVTARTVVFVRNDIFERLTSETPDRGKDSAVSLDVSDVEFLRELVRRRAVASLGEVMTFDELSQRFFELHVGGEEAFRFLFRHTFLRARDVLRLVRKCVALAVNRGHLRVLESDMRAAVEQHSHDLLSELAFEVRDTHGEDSRVLEEFVGAQAVLAEEQVIARLQRTVSEHSRVESLFDTLLWYSFLGVQLPDGSDAFAYQEQYNVARLLRRAGDARASRLFVIHPSFRAALHVPGA